MRESGYFGRNFTQGFYRGADYSHPDWMSDFVSGMPGADDIPRAWHGDMKLATSPWVRVPGGRSSGNYPTEDFWDIIYEPRGNLYDVLINKQKKQTYTSDLAAGSYFPGGEPGIVWRSGPNLRMGSHVHGMRGNYSQSIVERGPYESVTDWVDRIAAYYDAASAGNKKHEIGHHLFEEFTGGGHANLVRNLPLQTRLGLALAGDSYHKNPLRYGMINEAFARNLGTAAEGGGGLAWLLGRDSSKGAHLGHYLKTHGADNNMEKDLRLLGEILRLKDTSTKHSPSRRRLAKLTRTPGEAPEAYESKLLWQGGKTGYGDRELYPMIYPGYTGPAHGRTYGTLDALEFLIEMEKKGYFDSIPEARLHYDRLRKEIPEGIRTGGHVSRKNIFVEK